MRGAVVTFYSYKGGVGRTFALANTAVLLGRWGFRVLCIDWDLEAPGLTHFFEPMEPGTINSAEFRHGWNPGLVELLTDFRTTKQVPLEWRKLVRGTEASSTPGVSLLGAGRLDASYSGRLHKINWASMYRRGLGEALETMFDELREEFDYILIDARTGITDFAGVITAQLPDILAFLFTANWQSLEGSADVARRAAIARNGLAIDRSRLLLLPIPARYETQLEHKISAQWRETFVLRLYEFYEPWAANDASISKLIQATTIPYVPFWSFGERLSVVEDTSRDPLSINYSLETIAALLAHRLGRTNLLMESRDEFVAAARRLAIKRDRPRYDCFISYTSNDSFAASALAHSLARRNIRSYIDRERLQVGRPTSDRIGEIISEAEHMIVILGDKTGVGQWQDHEIRTFIRQAAADEGSRMLIPFSTGTLDSSEIPSLIRQFNVIPLGADYDAAAERIRALISPTPSVKAGSPDSSNIIVKVTADGDTPIVNATVTAQASNGTTVDSKTSNDGRATLRLIDGRAYTLLLAHPKYAGRVIEHLDMSQEMQVRMRAHNWAGSVVIHTSGDIPGLRGRLSPILDTSARTYLYADNIAIDDGQPQPVTFKVGEPLSLEDAEGNQFRVVILRIAGRTSLVQYERQRATSL